MDSVDNTIQVTVLVNHLAMEDKLKPTKVGC